MIASLTVELRRARRKRAGQALVPVLFVVIILTAFAVTLATVAKREARSSSTFMAETQQYLAARGAVNLVAAELQAATAGGVTPPQLTPPEDTDANGWSQLGDAWYKVDIIDTASRLNINTADGATLAKLPTLQNNLDLAAAIIDWRDTDDNPGTVRSGGSVGQGAESDYYQSLRPPYNAKNAPFDTVDELLLVRGMTPQMLYGGATTDTTNQNGNGTVVGVIQRGAKTRQTPGSGGQNSGQPAVDTSQSTTPLAELITTYSRELNVASDGTKRVNIRTANAQALQQTGMSRQLANSLVQARGNNGANITSISDLMNIPGFTRQVMQQIGDKLTVTDAQYRNGVVNINSAPAEVLATLPGVDQTIYNTVIQARQNGTVFTGLNDIFSLTQLSRTQIQALVNNVCTKSTTYLLRVRVRTAGSQKVYAAQALIELAAAQPQQSTGTTGTAAGTQQSQTTDTATAQTQVPTILQWREVPRTPGWSGWTPPPNYYTSSTLGGTVGNR